MPTLAAGNPRRSRSGFTLLELLVVLAIVAFASAAVGFALRDNVQTRLEREGLRLAALLEAGRARSQVAGVALRWRVLDTGFRFEGLPAADTGGDALPQDWLDPDTTASVSSTAVGVATDAAAAASLQLGPEPIIAPQSVTLYSRAQPDKRVRVATDGVRPFALQDGAP